MEHYIGLDVSMKKTFICCVNRDGKKVAKDTQAKFGCKKKDDYWYEYKRNLTICMKQSFIIKVAITSTDINHLFTTFLGICLI